MTWNFVICIECCQRSTGQTFPMLKLLGSQSKPFPLSLQKESKAGSKKTFHLGIRKRSVPISTGTESLSADPAANSSPESIAPDLKSLHLEVNRILSSDGILVHGPDNFEGFSLSNLLAELRQLAPGLVEL